MKIIRFLIPLYIFLSSYNLSAKQIIEPIMATIPQGSFEMGSLKWKSTQPVHTVNIEEFSMGIYEVTVQEFRQFIESTNYPAPKSCRHEMNEWFLESSRGNWETNALNTSEFQPVVCINWEAANAYANWLAEETGKPYRLPTESEWEYAARAGTKTDYYFGDDIDNSKVCEYANVGDLSGENILQRYSNTSYLNWSGKIANCIDHAGYASIVGMYKPNDFGLYDVLSNVQEFLADCYTKGYKHSSNDGSAYLSDNCKKRSIRGGSWHWSHKPLFKRSSIPEDFSGGVDGFRLALDGKSMSLSERSKAFLSDLTFAQQQEKKRRKISLSIPKPLMNVELHQNDKSVTLTWDKSQKGDVDGYRIYRNLISKGMVKLLASNLTENIFIDSNIDQHKYDYYVVAVKNNIQSNYSSPVTTKPGWIDVSKRIESEWASEFNNSSISFSSDERGGSVLKDIEKGAIIKYQLNIPTEGYYQIKIRVSSIRNSEGFKVYSNQIKAGINPITKTGGYHEWETQKGIIIYLTKGRNTLTLESLDNSWNLNWISLSEVKS